MKNKFLNAFVIALILFQAVAPIGALAWVGTDQYIYYAGDIVYISGNEMQAEEMVNVDIFLPDGSLTQHHEVVADSAGNFTDTYVVPDNAPSGIFTVVTIGQSSGNTFTTTFDPPTQTRIRTATMDPISGDCGTTISVYATLEYKSGSDWFAFSGKTVSFTLGSSTGSDTTDSSGVATVDLLVSSGAASLVASYAGEGSGNSAITSTSQNISFTVTGSCTSPSTTTVTVSNAVYDGNPHGGTAVVTGAGGLNQSLTVTYAGRNSTVYASSTIAPTNVGDYTASASFSGDATHTGSSDSKDYSITKATSTTTVTGGTFSYDGSAHPATVSVTGAGGLNLNPVPVYSGACSAAPVNVSDTPCTASYSYAGDDNHTGSSGFATINISQASSVTTVTFETGPYTYRGSAFTATAVVTGAGLNQPVPVVYTGDCTNVTSANGCTATATFGGDGNHTSSSDTKSITIGKANAVCTVNGFTGSYDSAAHGATGSCTGVGGVDLSAGLNLGVTFTDYPGGTVHWTFTGGTNYNDQAGDVNIVINKADASCAVNGYTGAYDGASHGATGSCTGVSGVDLSAGLNLGGALTDYPGGTVHWTFTGGTNYNDQAGDVNITINKADASCTVNGYTGTYDGASHGATGSCTGVADADLSAGLNLGSSFTDYPGGTAHWTFSGGTNYSDESGDVAIVINKAEATCLVNGYSDTYDAAAHGATGSCTGVGGANLNAGLNLGDTFTNVPGGTAHWTFTGGTNYNDQAGDVAVTINKANAICTVNGYSDVYDAAAHGATGSCTGVGGVDLNASLNLGATFTNVPGGTAHWSFTGGTNYNNQEGDASIVITQADAECSVVGYSGVYDAAFHGASGSCSGIGGEDAGTLDFGATFKNVSGGTAHWVFTGNGNYNNQAGTAEIVLTPAEADCSSIAGYHGVYDAAFHGASGSCTGVGTDGTLIGLDLGDSFKDVPGGTAHWTFANGNYNPQSGDANIAITPANAACTINGYTGVYNAAFHGASGSCTGVGSDGTLSGLDLGDSFKDVPGGTAHWTFEGGTNYNDQSGTASIVITTADATCTISGYSGVYDASAHGASGSCTGVGGDGTLSGLSLGATFTDYPGGTAHWTFAGGTNYNNQSGDASIEISKANATINVVGYTGTYDATAHGASGTATGVGGVDLSAGLSFGSTFTNVPGGTAHWTFTGGTNYNNAAGDAAIVINKANATCTVTGYDVIFDNNDHTATGVCKGVLNETLAGLDLSHTTHKFVGTWSDAWSFTDITGNYNNTSGTVSDKIGSWSSNGFFQPVDMNNVLNTIKAGQTVPLKFELFSGTTELTSTSAVNPLGYIEVSCTTLASAPVDDIETTATGGTALRYDTTAGQYIYNWKTPTTAGKCYRVTMTAQDGVTKIIAYFKTK